MCGHLKEFIEVMMMFFVVIMLKRTYVDSVNVVPVLELIYFLIILIIHFTFIFNYLFIYLLQLISIASIALVHVKRNSFSMQILQTSNKWLVNSLHSCIHPHRNHKLL